MAINELIIYDFKFYQIFVTSVFLLLIALVLVSFYLNLQEEYAVLVAQNELLSCELKELLADNKAVIRKNALLLVKTHKTLECDKFYYSVSVLTSKACWLVMFSSTVCAGVSLFLAP
jgi:hypothetical protein